MVTWLLAARKCACSLNLKPIYETIQIQVTGITNNKDRRALNTTKQIDKKVYAIQKKLKYP